MLESARPELAEARRYTPSEVEQTVVSEGGSRRLARKKKEMGWISTVGKAIRDAHPERGCCQSARIRTSCVKARHILSKIASNV